MALTFENFCQSRWHESVSALIAARNSARIVMRKMLNRSVSLAWSMWAEQAEVLKGLCYRQFIYCLIKSRLWRFQPGASHHRTKRERDARDQTVAQQNTFYCLSNLGGYCTPSKVVEGGGCALCGAAEDDVCSRSFWWKFSEVSFCKTCCVN